MKQADWNKRTTGTRTGTRGRFWNKGTVLLVPRMWNYRTVPDVPEIFPNRDLLPYLIIFPYPFTTVTLNPSQYTSS